jgi:hypothetical protein
MPNPVLILVCFLGVVLYVCIGAIVSPLFLRISGAYQQRQLRDAIAGLNADAGAMLVVCAVLWPIFLSLLIVVGIPWYLGTRICRYVLTSGGEK